MADIERFLTDENLKSLTSAPMFERGCEYAQHLRVVRLRRRRGAIEATVEGTDDYEVRLTDEVHRLGFSCTCPVGQRKQFCKHAVATALTWMREHRDVKRERPPTRTVLRLPDIRAHLLTLDKAELVERLLAYAGHSGERLDEMKLDAAWRGPQGPDIPALKYAIRNWMWTLKDAHNVGITPMAVPRVELMVAIIRGLVRDGRGDEALALLDCVFRTAPVSTYYRVDHDGEEHRELLRAFQQLHHDACRMVRPPPERLARDLIDYEVESDIGVFDGALKQYSALLGRKGRQSYLQQIEDLARALAPADPKRTGTFGPAWNRRQRLFHLVEQLDLGLPPEWYADVLGRDIHWHNTACTVASKFAAAGKAEEALHWVEGGMGWIGHDPDPRLLELGLDICRAQGWPDRAIAMVLKEFARRPYAETFAGLRSLGLETGQWPGLRRQAFRIARQAVAKRRRSSERDLDFFGTRRDVSLLVEMHLADEDLAAARRAARRGYCQDAVWVKLADAVGLSDPEAAATLYELRLRQLLLAPSSDKWPEECKTLLVKLKACRERSGQPQRFQEWMENARLAYRENKSLQELLTRDFGAL